MTNTCGYSTGSMTGCQPLCDRPATHNVQLHMSGMRSGPLDQLRCAEHVRPTETAAYPYRVETVELRQPLSSAIRTHRAGAKWSASIR